MKLLIITQKVDINDDLLGFFHQWIKKLAGKCQSIIVICLYKGAFQLPENVRVLSLGKENSQSKLKYLINFYKYIWHERRNYDAVFVHMVPLYLNLGGLLWRLWHKKTVLWYAHYLVDFKLKLAVIFSQYVVTSTDQACLIKSKKLKVIGQGIDIDFFIKDKKPSEKFKILFLGRISPVKDLETLIGAMAIAIKSHKNIEFNMVGAPIMPDDFVYLEKIKNLIKEAGLENITKYYGRVSYPETKKHYQSNDLYINLTRTGSFDKTILEAMSCELPVLVCNKSFENIFPEASRSLLIYQEKNSRDLADRIEKIINLTDSEKQGIGNDMRAIIVKNHSLDRLTDKLFNLLS